MGICAAKQDEEFDYENELLKDTVKYSVEVGPSNAPDVGAAHRMTEHEGKLHMDERTIWQLFCDSKQKWPDAPYLGTRKYSTTPEGVVERSEYKWISYAETQIDTEYIAAGLRLLGISKGMTVGICAANCHEWAATAMGCYSMGAVVVALYDSLGPEAVTYILDHAEIEVACCSKKKLPVLMAALGKVPKLRHIVVFDPDPRFGEWATDTVTKEEIEECKKHGIILSGFQELKFKGKHQEAESKAEEVTHDDLALIMYTSGTTGMPKGVMLKHHMLTSIATCGRIVNIAFKEKDEVHISFLPLAHIFETMVQLLVTDHGGRIGFFQGNIRKLLDDIVELRPTVFAGVPRVFSKIHDKLMLGVNKFFCIKKNVIKNALLAQAQRVRRGQPRIEKHDKKIICHIREKLGLDRCHVIVSGAAPLPPYLHEFLNVVVNPSEGVVQGYGLTETCSAMCVSQKTHTLGHNGAPLPCVEIRLKSVEEMGYSVGDLNPRGEIQCRGPSVFAGYFKNEKATHASVDKDGWFSTGDIGRWNPNGTLSIIDRKKNIFKLSHGEYVASEQIEAVYSETPIVSQAWLYGNSYKPVVLAVIVPDAALLSNWMKQKGYYSFEGPMGSAEMLTAFEHAVETYREEVTAYIFDLVKKMCRKQRIKSFEIPAKIYVEAHLDEMLQGFSVENDMMTPTFKLRRVNLLKHYREKLIEMYTDVGHEPRHDEKW